MACLSILTMAPFGGGIFALVMSTSFEHKFGWSCLGRSGVYERRIGTTKFTIATAVPNGPYIKK